MSPQVVARRVSCTRVPVLLLFNKTLRYHGEYDMESASLDDFPSIFFFEMNKKLLHLLGVEAMFWGENYCHSLQARS